MTDNIKHLVSKVGIVPYRWRGHEAMPPVRGHSPAGAKELEFLIHLPKYDPNKGGNPDTISWGLARGTVKYEKSKGNWQDLRTDEGKDIHDPELLKKQFPLEVIQDHPTAIRDEAKEELGINLQQYFEEGRVRDHGIIMYHSQSNGRDGKPKGPYGIHFYSVPFDGDATIGEHVDAQDLAWKTLPELREMVDAPEKRNQFKREYIDVVEQIDREIRQQDKSVAAR